MVRKNQRQPQLTLKQVEEHLTELENFRSYLTGQQSVLKPYSGDFNAMATLISAIDEHQIRWTGKENYMWDHYGNRGARTFHVSNDNQPDG